MAKSPIRWEKKLAMADGHALMRAVIETYASYADQGFDPGSDRFEWSPEERAKLADDVFARFASLTGCPEYRRPWRESIIVGWWIEWRKITTAAGRRRLCDLVGAEWSDRFLPSQQRKTTEFLA